MSGGYTDALVLIASEWWWPSLQDACQYPLTPSRTFFAAITAEPTPWSSSNNGRQSCALSRLGVSVFLLATYADDGASVEVFCPFSGSTLRLRVCEAMSGDSEAKSPGELAQLGRLRITPRTSADDNNDDDVPPTHILDDGTIHSMRVLMQKSMMSVLDHLHEFCRRAASRGRHSHESLLITGDGAATFAELVVRPQLPRVVVMGADNDFVELVLEHRSLRISDLLAMDEREAVMFVEVLLRPPPEIQPASSTTCARRLLVVVMMDGLHLLRAGEDGAMNALTAAVCCQICASIDGHADAEASAVSLITLTSADNVDGLPVSLTARLAGAHVRLAPTPTAEELAGWINYRGTSSCKLWDDDESRAAALTNWPESVHALVRLGDDEVAQLIHQRAAAARASRASIASSSSVYAHLFGMDDAIAALEELIVWPLTHVELMRQLHVRSPRGALLCGPSGVGRTALLAALVQRLALPDVQHVHVMMMDALTLYAKEVGRTEQNIANLFAEARAHAPTALILDNLDAIAPPRGRSVAEVNATTDRALSTLLTHMDGVGGGAADGGLIIIASAPSVDVLDPAVCRPGRLDVHLQLRLPAMHVCVAAMMRRIDELILHLNDQQQQQQQPLSALDEEAKMRVERRVRELLENEQRSSPLTGAAIMSMVRELLLLLIPAHKSHTTWAEAVLSALDQLSVVE